MLEAQKPAFLDVMIDSFDRYVTVFRSNIYYRNIIPTCSLVITAGGQDQSKLLVIVKRSINPCKMMLDRLNNYIQFILCC